MRRHLVAVLLGLAGSAALAAPPSPSTFSIAAADPAAGEVGIAVASRFFAVGAVVPHASAGIGAVATQSFANVSFGPRGLELLARGVTPSEAIEVLLRSDDGREQRQVGIVAADGTAATFTGSACNAWAGGRSGPGYAVQGNILTGEAVVVAMERAFLDTAGKSLGERLYAALAAGDAAGGDSRGRQSAVIVVHRAGAGYGGYTDQAIDIRVDDHADPIGEIGRLLQLAQVNDSWNRGWSAFQKRDHAEALRWQERTAQLAETQPAMLPEVLYDLAVIRTAAGDLPGGREALQRAVALNPKLAAQAAGDRDLAPLRSAQD